MFKETKKGQTHSYNDGCGEPAHNSMPQNLKQFIGEKVDEVLHHLSCGLCDGCENVVKEALSAVSIETLRVMRKKIESLYVPITSLGTEYLNKRNVLKVLSSLEAEVKKK